LTQIDDAIHTSVIFGTLAAAAVLAVAQQRIAITVNGSAHTFVLRPLSSGPLLRDSGTESGCCWSQRFVMRHGQKIEINDPLATYVGKRGTFVLRLRVEWVDAGNGYSVGTGTWRVVRGTGAYAHLTGSGGSALSWPPGGFASAQSQGFVTLH
jgi:hypothetical protein